MTIALKHKPVKKTEDRPLTTAEFNRVRDKLKTKGYSTQDVRDLIGDDPAARNFGQFVSDLNAAMKTDKAKAKGKEKVKPPKEKPVKETPAKGKVK